MFLFRSLASGSSGNAYLLRTGRVTLLFEAGLRYPTLRRYLSTEGVEPGGLHGVLISHEHRDHCGAARELAAEYGTEVWANAKVLHAAGLHDLPGARIIEVDTPTRFGDAEVVCFPVPHDSVAPVGFLIRACGRTISIATDAGEPTTAIAEAVAAADLVVLEANHDTEMLHRGRYPYHLRRRVGGATGHLSNTQAAAILSRSLREEAAVWLAHLSKENNTQTIATQTVKRQLRVSGHDTPAVEVAQRDRPSLRWNGESRPRQLSLFDVAGQMPT